MLTGELVLEYYDLLLRNVGAYRKKVPYTLPTGDAPLDLRARTEWLINDMAKYVGMPGCHFVVAVKKDISRVAGRVHLMERVGFTLVEIDAFFFKHENTLIAILAHELAHKFLKDHKLEREVEENNEYLTDITSVYLGFGKFVLNGVCYSGYNSTNEHYSGKVGYLAPSVFAFVYDMVSCSLGISEEEMLEGLSCGAQKLIVEARSSFQKIYPSEFVTRRMMMLQLKDIRSSLEKCDVLVTELLNISDTRFEGLHDVANQISEKIKEYNGWWKYLDEKKQQFLFADNKQTRLSFCEQLNLLEDKVACLYEKIMRIKGRVLSPLGKIKCVGRFKWIKELWMKLYARK